MQPNHKRRGRSLSHLTGVQGRTACGLRLDSSWQIGQPPTKPLCAICFPQAGLPDFSPLAVNDAKGEGRAPRGEAFVTPSTVPQTCR